MSRILKQFLPLLLLVACKAADKPAEYLSSQLFSHGVASGDPLNDGVIIWTRVSSPFPDSILNVEWEMARDPEFRIPVQQGSTHTSAKRDFTVKVDIGDLRPNSTYYYRFRAFNTVSPTGRTRTSATGDLDSLRFAVVSCSNYEWGYFNAYRHISRQQDLMAVIHLGDYIYEYGTGVYGDTTIGRIHNPPHELLSLDDYRSRYAQYRSDPDLQEVHRLHPFITTWDDHEIANNAYAEGAENHQPEEGSYAKRREIAKKVYYEWMPVRDGEQLYRKFDFGRMARLIMLDERLAGRSAPVKNPGDSSYHNEERTILGNEQYKWLTDALVRSRAKWKIIGNQVIFSRLNLAQGNMSLNMDAWDGYPAEQKRLGRLLAINQFDNLIFVTGDTHASWAFETRIDNTSGQRPLAVEFGTTSVNSANSNESYADSLVIAHEDLLLEANPHLKYVNLRDHGYLLLTLKQDYARADFYYVPTNRERSGYGFLAKQLWIRERNYKLLESPPRE